MALIQFETTGATGSSTPLIVDVDVPAVVTGCGAGCATFSVAITGTGVTTIDLAISPSIPTNDDHIYNTLNKAIKASIADPYKIPVIDSIDIPGGYLEPDTVYTLTGMVTAP